ncbi:Gfo/Idh/MocA family protein [Oenococcus sp.]|uniref:Gfo/Idh/MocA family protein n=1 Tax=Oenococcus sp. TaxID=1979414 RepID=UPI0039E85FB2
MIKLGLVGTHWITAQFAQAAIESQGFIISAVYSRSKETADDFIKQIGQPAAAFDNFDAFLDSGIQAVYLASPNSFHFRHAQSALKHGLDIIVEKPSFSNTHEFQEIMKLLAENPERRFFEAARNYHDPIFKIIKDKITDLKTIQGANLVYANYSSRYDQYLADPLHAPNVFTRKFSGGALYDLGVYPLYDAIGWFGYPDKADYRARLLENGIDGSGVISLDYAAFTVNILISKIFTSSAPSEVFGLKDRLLIDSPSELNHVELIDGNGHREQLALGTEQNPLLAEARDFARILSDRHSEANLVEYENWLATASQINQLMFDLRKSAGIRFAADD